MPEGLRPARRRRFLAVVSGARALTGLFLVSVACSGDETAPLFPETAATSGAGGGATTAITSASTATSAQHASSSASTGGSGGEGGALAGPPYPIVLAHGFFGFEDFAGAGFLSYFYGVRDDLASIGEDVFTPAVDPFNDSTFRGAQLVAHIEAIREATHAEKVVIVGHSQGGLDARVVAHDRPDLVAAVITIATPHGGTPVADIAVGLLGDPNAAALVDVFVNLIGAPLYDEVGNETAVTKPLHLFSEEGIAAFDAAYPDAPGVFYASIAGRSDLMLAREACTPDEVLPFIDDEKDERDPIDPLFFVPEAILDGLDPFDPIANDGLVRVRDARHGAFWGCIPADHTDQIGQIPPAGPGLGNGWDHLAFYRALVAEIRKRGY